MSDWIPFHRELTMGAKRALPRAARFIYLELALEARKLKGFIPLPSGLGDVAAVHAILGGDRREVESALKLLTAGADPMVQFITGDDTHHRTDARDASCYESVRLASEVRYVCVKAWRKWNFANPSGAARKVRFNDRHAKDVADVETTVPEEAGTLTRSTTERIGNVSLARARLLSLSISSEGSGSRSRSGAGSLGGVEPEGGAEESSGVVRGTLAPEVAGAATYWSGADQRLTPERRSYAEMVGLTDVDEVWSNFGSLSVERAWCFAPTGWEERWKRFCRDELRIQRRRREAARGSASTVKAHAVQPFDDEAAWLNEKGRSK